MSISFTPHFTPDFVKQRIFTARVIFWLRVGLTIGLIGWLMLNYLFQFISGYHHLIIIFVVPLAYGFLSDFLKERLRCPACQAQFDSNPKVLFCAACGLGAQGLHSESEYKQQRQQYGALYQSRQQAYEKQARVVFWALFIGGGFLGITALFAYGQWLPLGSVLSQPVKWLSDGMALALVIFLLGLPLYMQHKMRCPACNARISARPPTKYCPTCGTALV